LSATVHLSPHHAAELGYGVGLLLALLGLALRSTRQPARSQPISAEARERT
jgi:hypothetical protein